VYVLSDGALAVFRRSASGALSPAGCLSTDGTDGACTPYEPLYAAIDLAVSPDGANVYVTTYSPGAILVFRRNTGTGALAPLAPVTTGTALEGVADVVVSPDGTNVYAAAPYSDAVLAFARGANGRLEQLPGDAACVGDAEASTGCTAGEVLTRAGSLAISPDSRHVYVASVQAVGSSCACGEELGTLSVFTREVAQRLAFHAARPPAVRAGRPFRIAVPVDATGTPTVACTARVGSSAIRTTSGYAARAATCSGTVPKGTAGKRLTVVYRARLGALARTSTLSLTIAP
jgi:DNA-binding beta-propeller fold protein YncE